MRSKDKAFKMDMEYRIFRIRHLAKKYGWAFKKDDGEKFEFQDKEGSTLHINYFQLNVATALQHPKWGSTVLIRRGNLTQKIVESIFRNPRAHMPDHINSQYNARFL